MVVSKGYYIGGKPLPVYTVYYYDALGLVCSIPAIGQYGVYKTACAIRAQGGKPIKAKLAKSA